MPSFGEKLKREREKRSITLEQIAQSTKIGTRMLQALEDEQFGQLPGGIFNKGFVRAYARHVGLDEEETIADFLAAAGETPLAMPEIKPESPGAVDRTPFRFPDLPWGWLAAAAVLLALAFWLWNRPRHGEASEPASAAQSAVPSSTPAAPPVTAAQIDARPAPASDSAPRSAPLPAATPSAAQAGEFTVVILAREDSWVSIATDGKPPVEETLIGENQRAVHARDSVVIKAGNVGALDFVFNNRKLASQGDYGEVKTLTFGPGGLQPKPVAAPPAH